MRAEPPAGPGVVVRCVAVVMVAALVAGACTSSGPSSDPAEASPSGARAQVDCDSPCSWSEAEPEALDRSINALQDLAERYGQGAGADELVAYLESLGAENIVSEEWGIEFSFPGGLVVAHLSDLARGRFGETPARMASLDDLGDAELRELDEVSAPGPSEMVPVTWDPAGEPAEGVRVLVLEPWRYEDPDYRPTGGEGVVVAAREAADKVRHLEYLVDEQASLEVFRTWNQWDVIFWLSHGSPTILSGAKAEPYVEFTERGWRLRADIEPGVSFTTAGDNENPHLAFSEEFFLNLGVRDDQVLYLGLCDSGPAWRNILRPNSTVFAWNKRVPFYHNHDVARILGDLLFTHGYSSLDAYAELVPLGLYTWRVRTGKLRWDSGRLLMFGEHRRSRDTVTLRSLVGEPLVDGMTVAIDGVPDDGQPDSILIDFLLEGVPPDTIHDLTFTVLLDGVELEHDLQLVDVDFYPPWYRPHHPVGWVGSGRAQLNTDLTTDDIGRLHDLRIEVEDSTPGPTAHEVQIAMGPCYWSGVLGGAEQGDVSGRAVGISQTGGLWTVYLGQVRADQPGTSMLLAIDGDPTQVSSEDLPAGAWMTVGQFPLAIEGLDRTSRVRITLAEPALIVGGVAASASGLAADFDTEGTVTFDGIFVWSPACPSSLDLIRDR
jgi:hypothetical protein